MASPFTFTPGKAGDAYIDMHYVDEIVDNFNDPSSEKYVYKILGLRGSGKSVVYSKVIRALREDPGWKVYTLSSGNDPLQTLIGLMSKEDFISSNERSVTYSAEGGVEGNVLFAKGSGKVSAEVKQSPNQHFYSSEAAIKEMMDVASEEGFKVLVGIDDIAKTKDMVRFLSIVGDMVLDDRKKIYLLCTGTSKNIEDFADEPHLSFFVRSDKIEIKELSIPQMTLKYGELLNAPVDEAKKLALYTRGYAYAYQVVGELCYKYKTTELTRVEMEFDAAVADQYDIIWGQLSDCERELVKAIVSSKSGETKDIKNRMDNSANYNALRARLNKKHLINTNERGILTIDLPRFTEYVDMWHTEQEILTSKDV